MKSHRSHGWARRGAQVLAVGAALSLALVGCSSGGGGSSSSGGDGSVT